MEELKIFEYCMQIGEKACEQELERQKIIAAKADYLFKYLTLLATAFSIAVPVIAKMQNVSTSAPLFTILYLLLVVTGIFGIFSTLMIQKPRKIRQFPLATDELKKIQAEPVNYDRDCKQIYRKILYTDKITQTLRENNDKTMNWIFAAYSSLGVMIVLSGAFITYIICFS